MNQTAKVKSLQRREIENLLVTDADAFTVLRYLRHREAVPTLPELEEKGQKAIPGVEGALCDLYHSLWSPEPSVKEEVATDRKYWQGVLGEALKTASYEELHGQTQLKELQSVLGTIAMGESVLALVPKEDQEKLKELSEAQEEANEASQQAQEAQANAQAAQQLADASAKQANGPSSAEATAGKQGEGEGQPSDQQADGNPQPGSGKSQGKPQAGSSGMTKEQAKAIANQLAKTADKAQADAKAAKELADEAKVKAEQIAEDLMGKPGSEQAQQEQRELARIGLQAVKDAKTKVQEISETVDSWGLEEGELYRQGIPETLGLLERMRRNTAFKKFAALLGRLRKIAARKARSKVDGEGVRATVTETGRDLKRAQPAEMIALTNPALRVKALQRWTRGELRLFGQKTRNKLGHGPVIVCEDGSGSMEGEKQQWAKAVTLSMAHFAKLQKRSFGWILFDSSVRKSKVYPQGQISGAEMLELAESRAGGGTDFERPLRKALEMIQKEGLKKADICLITDGDCAVSDEFLKQFGNVKKSMEINIFTVLCDVGHITDKTVREFSDRVERVSDFSAEEAERKIFGHL